MQSVRQSLNSADADPHTCRPLRLVQVGFGYIGHRRTLVTTAHRDIELVAIVDVDPQRLAMARDLVGDHVMLGTDHRQVLRLTRPDAVIVSTPNVLHAPMALDALNMGIHVLCEKPLAINAALAARCVAAARRMGCVLKMGTNHRYWRGVVRLVNMVSDGAVGDVERISGEIGHEFPDTRSEWYREPRMSGGGALIDNGPHLLDAVRHILAVCDGDRIRTVSCRTAHERDGLAVEDRATGNLVSARGREVDFVATWSDGPYRMNLDVVGTRGRLSLHGFEELTFESEGENSQHQFTGVPALESWQRDVDAFVTRLRGEHVARRFDENDTGLATAEIVDALYRSDSRNASPVDI